MKLKKLLGLALSGVLTISAIGCSKTQPENIDEKGSLYGGVPAKLIKNCNSLLYNSKCRE